MGEVDDDRGDQTGVELLGHAAEEVLGHAGLGDGGDGVDHDVLLRTLGSEHAGEADEAHLGCAVVGLAEVAGEAGVGRRVDHSAVALLTEVEPCRLGDVERTTEVHVEDGLDLGLLHLVEGLVPEDAGVVDDDVDSVERIDGRLDDRLAAFGRCDAVAVGYRLATEGLDLFDDPLGGCGRAAASVDGATEVVDDDTSSTTGELERVLAAEAAACTGDDRYLAVESEVCHGCSPLVGGWSRAGRA